MNERIGLVLGAGGMTGHAWHVGALTALADVTGFDARDAEIIVGTSAGSGIGAYLRGGLSPTDLLHRLSSPPTPKNRDRFERMNQADEDTSRVPRWLRPQAPSLAAKVHRKPFLNRPLLALTALLPEGRIPTAAVGTWAEELHGDAWPERPLWITAVRLADGRRVVFGRAADDEAPAVDPATAMEASCAIPSFFRPVAVGDHRYVDGGMHSPTNADLLAEPDAPGLDLVIVSSPMSASGGVGNLDSRRYLHLLLDRECERLAEAGHNVVRLEPDAAVVAEIGRRRGVRVDGMADLARAARASVATHLRSERMADRLAPLAPSR